MSMVLLARVHVTFRVPVFDWYGSMYIFAHTGEVVCRKAYRRVAG